MATDDVIARKAGQRIAGRYELGVRLGRGAMGVVYQARDEIMRRDVALKVLTADLEDDPEIDNDWHIIVEVQVPRDATAEFFVETDQQWCREIFEHCPARYVCVFRLGVTPSA